MNSHLLTLTLKSANNRKANILLAVISIALSVALLLSVDTIRKQAKQSFLNTVSETDLIIGARSGPINLMLYSVFHIGNATNNMSYRSYESILKLKEVKWAIPLSLGDSHKGFRVIGTESMIYKHYRYGDNQMLEFSKGKAFNDLYDAVIGYNVAKKLGYQLGQKIILAHGSNAHGNPKHDDKPFIVTGILAPTATPIDNSVQVSLKAIEAIHIDWQSGSRSPLKISQKITRKLALKPKEITAILVGLNSPTHIFKVQRSISQWRSEPLMAILPGATLAQLWQSIGLFEKALLAISVLVVISALIGMLITLLSTLNERRREIAILRAVGMHSWDIVKLFALEASLIMFFAITLGILGLYAILSFGLPLIASHYGMQLHFKLLDSQQALILSSLFALALLLSLVPGWLAYRKSLSDGLTIKN